MKDIIKSGIYVFEGIDNVGKSTIIRKLKDKIDESSEKGCSIVAFPGNDSRTLGELVYDIHHHQNNYFDLPLNDCSLQLLHVASHIDLIQRKILPMMKTGKIILMDRFWWSTYVYGIASGLTKEVIETIISPEMIYWQPLDINKIFMIERENRIHDYIPDKDMEIVNLYRNLTKTEPKCTIFHNDCDIEESVCRIYNVMLGE